MAACVPYVITVNATMYGGAMFMACMVACMHVHAGIRTALDRARGAHHMGDYSSAARVDLWGKWNQGDRTRFHGPSLREVADVHGVCILMDAACACVCTFLH